MKFSIISLSKYSKELEKKYTCQVFAENNIDFLGIIVGDTIQEVQEIKTKLIKGLVSLEEVKFKF